MKDSICLCYFNTDGMPYFKTETLKLKTFKIWIVISNRVRNPFNKEN